MKPTTTLLTLLLPLLTVSTPVINLPRTSVTSSATPRATLSTHSKPRHLDGTSFGVPGDQTFDYVIVGGGTAGLALANRLSENAAWNIAVIEAGGFYETDYGNVSQIALFASSGTDKSGVGLNPMVDWGFVTEPQAVSGPNIFRFAPLLRAGCCDQTNVFVGCQQCCRALCTWEVSRWQLGTELHGISAWYSPIVQPLGHTGGG